MTNTILVLTTFRVFDNVIVSSKVDAHFLLCTFEATDGKVMEIFDEASIL